MAAEAGPAPSWPADGAVQCDAAGTHAEAAQQGQLRRLAVLFIVFGKHSLSKLILRLRCAVGAAIEWVRHHHAALLASPVCLLRWFSSAPTRFLLRLLSQLVSLTLTAGADEHREPGSHMAGQVGARLALLFGAVRLRTHASLQFATPSLQPAPLLPKTAAQCSPQQPPRCVNWSDRHSSSPVLQLPWTRQPGDDTLPNHQHQQLHHHYQQQQHQQQQHNGDRVPDPGVSCVPEGVPGDEVHILCSSELKSAILGFLGEQGRRESHGHQQPDYIVLQTASGAGAGSGLGARHQEDVTGVSGFTGMFKVPPWLPRFNIGATSCTPQEGPGVLNEAKDGGGAAPEDSQEENGVFLTGARSVRESCELFEGLRAVREQAAAAAAASAAAMNGISYPRPVVQASGGPTAPSDDGGLAATVASLPTTAPEQPSLPSHAPMAAAAAALYASAAPAGRISPIAHPARHGRTPLASRGHGGTAAGVGAPTDAPALKAWTKQLPPAPLADLRSTRASSKQSSPDQVIRSNGLRSLLSEGDEAAAAYEAHSMVAVRRSLVDEM